MHSAIKTGCPLEITEMGFMRGCENMRQPTLRVQKGGGGVRVGHEVTMTNLTVVSHMN